MIRCVTLAILCPTCGEPININPKMSAPKCNKGHSYALRNGILGILDLLYGTSDENIFEEEKYWDGFAQRGRLSISPDAFMKEKIFEQYRLTFQHLLSSEWPDIAHKTLCIVEIGCGSGSAMQFLGDLVFSTVDYVGIDISSKFMSMCGVMPNSELPKSWKVLFVRASANKSIFKDSSLDIVFQHQHCIILMLILSLTGSQKP